MRRKAIPLNETLMDLLEDDDGICEYLTLSLEENGPKGFLLALKNVIEARDIHMSRLAQDAHLGRQNLYKMLSGEKNPRWENVVALVDALGIKISFGR